MARAETTRKKLGRPTERKSARGRDRREMILAEAAKLFRHRGFHATGIDDIGAAVGITGPGVYRHFASKQDLLAAIVERSVDRHQEIVDEVVAAGLSPKEALRRLVVLSADALAENRDAAAIYFHEGRNLDASELSKLTRVQRLLVTEWVQLLRAARPELDEEDARVAVRAAGGLLNSVAYFNTAMPPGQLGKLLARMALAALLAPANDR